jgi:hypothetical protein
MVVERNIYNHKIIKVFANIIQENQFFMILKRDGLVAKKLYMIGINSKKFHIVKKVKVKLLRKT